jgi:hypothetical protein
MDMVILTGMVSEEEMHHERPELLDRLRREGKLDALQTAIPPRRRLLSLALVGAIGLTIGLSLLIGILIGVFATPSDLMQTLGRLFQSLAANRN